MPASTSSQFSAVANTASHANLAALCVSAPHAVAVTFDAAGPVHRKLPADTPPLREVRELRLVLDSWRRPVTAGLDRVFTGLEVLHIDCNGLPSDAAIQGLVALVRANTRTLFQVTLDFIYIMGTDLLTALATACDEVEILVIRRPQPSTVLALRGGFPCVHTLRLEEGEVTAALIDSVLVANLENLSHLTIKHCGVSKQALPLLCKLSYLRGATIDNCWLADRNERFQFFSEWGATSNDINRLSILRCEWMDTRAVNAFVDGLCTSSRSRQKRDLRLTVTRQPDMTDAWEEETCNRVHLVLQ
jgi:hypothetical protein